MCRAENDSKRNTIYYNSLLLIASSVAFLLIIINACSPRAGNNLVRFFFDGVPEQKQQDTVAINGTAQAFPVKKETIATVAAQTDSSVIAVYIHPPYKERACTKCHQGDAPGAMKYAQDEFCYGCHKNFNTEYTTVHGPVAGGFCTNCHAPHKSENKKLLVRTGQAICITCHEKAEVIKSETHADIGKTPCTECHNPHGGSDRYFSY